MTTRDPPTAPEARRRARAPWREHALTRADELEALARSFDGNGSAGLAPNHAAIRESLERQLAAVREEHERRWARVRSWVSGSSIERAMSRLNAAEAHLLRIAPDSYIAGELESITRHVSSHLAVDDPRRTRVHAILERARHGSDHVLTDQEKETLIAAMRGASSEASREIMRVRSFRNVLVVAALILTGVAVLLAGTGAVAPERLAICFTVGAAGTSTEAAPEQEKVVCPTEQSDIGAQDPDEVIKATVNRWDVALIQLLGVVAAAVAAAASLRGIRGTSTPYSIPIALAALKLPTGALTAVLGLLLMRGQFIPGLSALDFPAQILGWAIVFGYAQQLFTGLVDSQAGRVLREVGGGLTRSSTE